MTHTIIFKFLLLCFILYNASHFQASACFLPRLKYYVYVINNLPPNSTEPLKLHCASKDNDLGYHTLTLNQNFNFNFCDNPFATVFFCHLWWGNKNKAFDAYSARWNRNPCIEHHCYWATKSDGIYFSDAYPPDNLVKGYDWE
ncbi:hypothetical protein DH2020_028341 [Rehmannia glutinosa]|uniref:S-protein homolog n=1 Tax=Rehmannia glutinosa TaxID=99300 RepID=A0ABR0VRL8_REHGL